MLISYVINYQDCEYKFQKNLYIAYSLWNSHFYEDPIKVKTDDIREKGNYALFPGISEIEFRMLLLSVDVKSITMVNENSSVTIDFESNIIGYYYVDQKWEEIEDTIKALCDNVASYPKLNLITKTQRRHLPFILSDKDMQILLLERLLSLPSNIYSDSGIAVSTNNCFKKITDINSVNGIEITEMMRYDEVSNTFVGYSSSNRKFIAYNLDKRDSKHVTDFIDNIVKYTKQSHNTLPMTV